MFSALMGILHVLFSGLGHAFEAIAAAATIAVFAMVFVFYSALALVIPLVIFTPGATVGCWRLIMLSARRC